MTWLKESFIHVFLNKWSIIPLASDSFTKLSDFYKLVKLGHLILLFKYDDATNTAISSFKKNH